MSQRTTLLELRFVVSWHACSATAYLRVDTVSVHALHSLRVFYGAAFAYTSEEISAVRTSAGPGYQRGLALLFADGEVVRTAGLQLLPG